MKRYGRHAGFTLFELILTVVLVGVISLVVGEILLQGYGTFTTAQNVSETDWQGLLVLESITNDVHDIRSSSDISIISSTNFSFVNQSGTTVTYSYSGSNLLRNGIILATGVSSFAFDYMDSAGSTTATPALVRYVSAAFSLSQNNLSQSYSTMAGMRGMS